MSLDRKYVIAAAVVGFVAWARLTDWFPSLRWVPHALVVGALTTAVLSVLWMVASVKRVGREDGTAILRQYGPVGPAFSTDKAVWNEARTALKDRAEYRRPIIFPEAVKFSKAVDGLLDLILRDYVTSWYGHISQRPLFQHEIDRCVRSVILSITSRLTEQDLVELATSKVLPIITNHLRDFYDAERVVRGKDLSNNVTESDELNTAIASKYKNGNLHPAASMSNSDIAVSTKEYLRTLIERILPLVLPANMRSSPSVTVLIREIVACAVLAPILIMLTDPDFWNQIIINVGGTTLQDRKTVRKVRAALDEHAPVSPKTNRGASATFRLKPYDSERQFERFVRIIRHVNTVMDARRMRNEVISQLRRDSAIEGQDAAYLRRLETGVRLLDQRIVDLSSEAPARPKLAVRPSSMTTPESALRKRHASLREVLNDATGLSYFMEFMDRQRLMRLVQFYLVVDGFRGPLENDADDAAAAATSDGERIDIAQMYSEYLIQPELQIPDPTLQTVRTFLKAGTRAPMQDYNNARRAILQSQTRIYDLMQTVHLESFRRSDLFYRWLAVDDATSSPLSSTRDSSPTPPALPRRPQPTHSRAPELRRAVLSTPDVKNLKQHPSSTSITTSNPLFADAPRRSLGDESARPALFDDDVEDERMVASTSSLRSWDSDGESAVLARERAKEVEREEKRAVDEMQVALDRIVGDEGKHGTEGGRESLFGGEVEEERRVSGGKSGRPAVIAQVSGVGKPSIASLGLVGVPSSRGVFVDDLFGEEAEKFVEDEREDGVANGEESEEDGVLEAAPGDLGLAEAIDGLNAEIERLNAQHKVLDSLTAKAELTNNAAELRILKKSEQSLQREIRRKEMQKQQYVVQESDNSLYGRATVSIQSVMVGREEDGHEFALYVIEVRRQAGDAMPAATWVITRRYSQFHELHKRLKARFPSVRDLDFPRRQALFTLQKDFIQKRRITLERYLRSLLLVPAICGSRELRAFLSQSAIASDGANGTQVDAKDFVTRIYNSVSDGMEEFLGNIPVLDQLSVAGQNLISAASAQITSTPATIVTSTDHPTSAPTEAEAELNAYDTAHTLDEPFVKPICDLFLETFELSKPGNSWLRGRTVVLVLHQLLGGTIERRVRDAARAALTDEVLTRYVETLKGLMWPGGVARGSPAAAGGAAPAVVRTAVDKAKARKEAAVLLGLLVPDLAGSVVGRGNAAAAGRKIAAMLNNSRLNTHLVFTLVDEVMRIVFPEVMDRT